MTAHHALFTGVAALCALVAGPAEAIRIATFNASLNRSAEGELVENLSTGGNAQAQVIAEIIQRVDPDVILINEFDYDSTGQAVRLFQQNYLGVSQNGAAPVVYDHSFSAPSNTGIPSGFDFNNDGAVGGPDDAYGFGLFPGQYGMAVYSKYDIEEDAIRTFQQFLWQDMPGNLLPTDFYSEEERGALRLSSKSHWDIPIDVDGETFHLLAAHPTPPTFDGAEDRNGRRNHDEIRLFADYVTPGEGDYIYDDEGVFGGMDPSERFVIVGDYNADPNDGDSTADAIDQFIGNALIDASFTPGSPGACEAALAQGGINLAHSGPCEFDTADFAEPPGNLRVDYVLPSMLGFEITGSGVFWPDASDPLSRLTGSFPFPSSDHRLVYLDLELQQVPAPGAAGLLGLALAGLVTCRRRKAS